MAKTNNKRPYTMGRMFAVGKWLVWGTVMILGSIALLISIHQSFRDAFVISIFLILITLILSAIILYYSDRGDKRICWYCIIVDSLLAIAIWIQVGSHFAMGREISAARDSTVERHQEEDRELERAKQLHQMKLESTEADIQLNNSEAVRSQAKANEVYQIRRAGGRLSGGAPAPTPKNESGAAPSGSEEPRKIDPGANARKYRRPEDIREEWSFFLLVLTFCETGAAILGASGLGVMFRIDKDKNDVPDWADRLAGEIGPVQFSKLYPEFAAKKYGALITPDPIEPEPSLPFSEASLRTLPATAPLKAPVKREKNPPIAPPPAGEDPGGKYVTVVGRLFPRIPGVRWEGKGGSTTVEAWTDTTPREYLGQFGKGKILAFDKLTEPQREQRIREAVEDMLHRFALKKLNPKTEEIS